MFQLSVSKTESLRSQIVTSKGRGGHRYRPYVFTEQGVAMLSSVLNSERAIQVNIQIMRAFTKLRELMSVHKDVRRQIEDMERKFEGRVKDHDEKFKIIFEAIKRLLEPQEKQKGRKGFHPY